ncbi:MAG: coproporphyrinogen III oxidase family protein, partial [Ruminococcus sp.]|nr:coproporphyrinogen III oxidase family protein [Ruminococcus sp.]
MSKNLGIYVHIPYCRSKCPYCDFFSMRATKKDYNNYVIILKKSIINWSEKTDKTVDTIYIGGGTPSVLNAQQIADIIYTVKSSFNYADNLEVTMEANPKSALDFDFSLAYKAGLNRV